MTRPLPSHALRRKRPDRVYRSTGLVDRYETRHPGVRAFIEDRLRRRFNQRDISRQVEKRFGLKISTSVISRFWMRDVRPQEEAEAAAYRQARAQARALLEEMKADPKLDAAQIAEIMLANQIVRDRTKLAEADILDLYKEQRERRKLELQRRALLLREKQAKRVLEKTKSPKHTPPSGEQIVAQIKEIYGLLPEPAPAPVG